jgi:peptide/nickel transport system permease protein
MFPDFLKKHSQLIESPATIAWKRFRKNYLALSALVFIVLVSVIATLGYLITPDSTPDANDINLALALQEPGFKIQLFELKNNAVFHQDIFKTMIWGKQKQYESVPLINYHFNNRNLITTIFRGTGLSTTEGVYNTVQIIYGDSNNSKGKLMSSGDLQKKVENDFIKQETFWLGTDMFGRDILSRLIIGLRVSLSVGFIAVAISLFIGIILGSAAGFFRGKTDDAITWLINVVWSIPTILLVFAITLALGKGFWSIFVAVGLTMWVSVARLIRGQVMGLREMEYVEAARSMGFSNWRIILRHIIPNVLGPVLVIASANFATAILIEAGLSFLGIGIQPPMPSLGTMVKENYGFIIGSEPFLAIIPGIAIMLLVLAFNIMGNALRDALDIKSKSV